MAFVIGRQIDFRGPSGAAVPYPVRHFRCSTKVHQVSTRNPDEKIREMPIRLSMLLQLAWQPRQISRTQGSRTWVSYGLECRRIARIVQWSARRRRDLGLQGQRLRMEEAHHWILQSNGRWPQWEGESAKRGHGRAPGHETERRRA
jgi:hypothetical protein